MTTNLIKGTLLLSVSVPVLVFAQLNTNVVGQVEGSVKAPIKNTLNTEVKTNLNVNVDGQVNTNVNSGIKTEVEMQAEMEAKANTDSNMEKEMMAKSEGEMAASVIVEKKIEYTENNEPKFMVKARHTGKLFGLFNVSFESDTEVVAKSDNTVEVSSSPSWWSVFVTGANYSRAQVEAAVKSSANLKAYLQANVKADAAVNAQVADVIAAEVRASTMVKGGIDAR